MSMKDWKGVLCLGVVTALAMGLIWGTAVLTRTEQGDPAQTESVVAERAEEMPVDGYADILKAVKRLTGDDRVEGYEVTVSARGYQGPISMTAYFDKTGGKLEKLEVTQQQETENLGGKIAEADFLDQFRGISLPVGLARAEKAKALPGGGNRRQAGTGNQTKDTAGQTENAALRLDWSDLRDGIYEARAEDYSNGFVDTLTMTVSGGKVTAFLWEATDAGGNTKRVLTAKGEYTMTENGLTWPQQADALAAQVIDRQSLEFLEPDQSGKTDAVAGVSISITPFLNLSRQCLIEAGAVPETDEEDASSGSDQSEPSPSGAETETETAATETESAAEVRTTQSQTAGNETENIPPASHVDGISGATISSAAVVEGVNKAYDYLQEMLEQ